MPKKIDLTPFKEEILKMVDERKSPREIAEKFKVCNSTMWLALKEWNYFNKHDSLRILSFNQENYLKSFYGIKTNLEISLYLKINLLTLNNYLKRLNIPLKGSGNRVIQTYNPFLESTDESNYWIGYIAGDGSISRKRYSISIFSKDYEVIEKFKTFYKGRVNVYNKEYKILSGAVETIYIININNELVHKYLISLGVTPNKSKTLRLSIPLNPSIIRGLLDSDGWVSSRECSTKITTGSIELAKDLVNFYFTYNIKATIVSKKGAYDVYVFNKTNISNLYYILYDNSKVFLQRKHDRFAALLKKFNIEKLGELQESLEEGNLQPS
jgi:DNA-binding transcriptional regulator WhiA